MTSQEIIDKWLLGVKVDLAANYNRLGLRASGNWEKQLEPFNNQIGGFIKAGMLGADYTGEISIGRSPNKNQSEEAIKKWVGWAGNTIIKQWVEDKGLDISPFAVAYKIARKGWEVPNKHNRGGLVTDVVNSKRVDKLNKELAIFTIGEIKQDLKRKIKDGNK